MDAALRSPGQVEPSAVTAAIRSLVEPAYRAADGAALRHQRRRRIIVDIVAVTGTIAVVLGTVSLTQPIGAHAIRIAEAVAAAAAIVAVVAGIMAGAQRQWLLERHKAELLRLLSLHAVVRSLADAWRDYALWSDDVSARVSETNRCTNADLTRWLASELPGERESYERLVAEATLPVDVHAYAREVIDKQRIYFAARAEANERWDNRTRMLIPALFFTSVVAIVPGALLRLWGNAPQASVFISIAVIAPAVSAGIRLFRSAHEFARNSVRFRTKALVLSMLCERINTETSPVAIVRDLEHAVQLMEAEHREWLRLMLDSEWYG
jgi:hypothetical protein